MLIDVSSTLSPPDHPRHPTQFCAPHPGGIGRASLNLTSASVGWPHRQRMVVGWETRLVHPAVPDRHRNAFCAANRICSNQLGVGDLQAIQKA